MSSAPGSPPARSRGRIGGAKRVGPPAFLLNWLFSFPPEARYASTSRLDTLEESRCSMKETYDFATLAVHAGEAPCPLTGAVDTPIYQSTTFASANADEMAAVYGEEKPGYMYTRYGNPTTRALEEKVAALECGEDALAFSAGMAAISSAILGY